MSAYAKWQTFLHMHYYPSTHFWNQAAFSSLDVSVRGQDFHWSILDSDLSDVRHSHMGLSRVGLHHHILKHQQPACSSIISIFCHDVKVVWFLTLICTCKACNHTIKWHRLHSSSSMNNKSLEQFDFAWLYIWHVRPHLPHWKYKINKYSTKLCVTIRF